MYMRYGKKCMNRNLGLLLIRLGLGAIFLYAGLNKLSDMSQTIGFFSMVGVGTGLTWAVALIETIGGAMMVLGLGTRVAGLALAVVMAFAIALVKKKMGFAAMEIDIMLLVSALGIFFTGPGRYALASLFHKKLCAPCANGTCSADGKSCGCSEHCNCN